MSAEQAVAVLGNPAWRGPCGARFGYGQATNCSTELGYRAALAPLNPVYRVVQIDSRNRVISSDFIGSP